MGRKALGKGLDALFSSPVETPQDETATGRRIVTIPVNDIIPNRQQPRGVFDESAMADLKASIEKNGILEPPVVRQKGDFFELIAGERRFRAAKELKFERIEVILMDIESEDQMLVLSLIENIQRENLNAIEEAKAFAHIMETMQLTQEGLSAVVGKSRSAIANTLRLLNLSGPVQDMVSEGSLAPGSARALVPVTDTALQLTLARKIAAKNLSTRNAEALVKQTLDETPKATRESVLPPTLEQARVNLQHALGTEVRIRGTATNGKIEIPYNSDDDLARILESIRGENGA